MMEQQWYLPHASCLLGNPWLVGALFLGNLMIAWAYIRIPLIYVTVMRQHLSVRSDPGIRSIYRWTASFIFCCALTHLFGNITLFLGGWFYWVEALMLLVTAGVSVYTAERIFPLLIPALTRRETLLNDVMAHFSKKDGDEKEQWERHAEILHSLQELRGKN